MFEDRLLKMMSGSERVEIIGNMRRLKNIA